MRSRHLYVHVPFCSRRCSYCDFAIAVRRVVPVADYLRGVASELRAIDRNESGPLDTIYLGGGTPSRLGEDGVSALIRLVHGRFDVAEDAEFTIEANPEDVTERAAAAWVKAGVNRISIGVQSFDDEVLRWMHRVHDGASAAASVATARAAGIGNISIDLIFALPPEVDRSWKADLETALGLSPEHISLYGLTVEPATPLSKWQLRGDVSPALDDTYAEQFLLAHEMAAEAGYRHYEVSNFARPGRESRHNSAYWTGAPYIGIGPSAHSYDGETRTWNAREYPEWLERLDAGAQATDGVERLTTDNRASERVYLGLRTVNGYRASGSDLETARRWMGAGWANLDDDLVRLTPEGWLRLDSLSAGLTGF